MKDGLSSRSPRSSSAARPTGAHARAAVAAMIAGAALAACSLDTGGQGQTPTGSGGMGGAGGSGASGPGGAGGSGAAGGAGGAGGGSPGTVWTAGAPDPVSGAYDLPQWLSFESPSTNKTVQTGPGSLRTGFDVDAARARSVDGVTWGLAVEGERTNRMVATRFALGPWTVFGGAITAPTTGPDETDVARLITDQSTTQQGALVINFLGALGATSTISAWVSTPATNTVDSTVESNNLAPPTIASIDPGAGWHRISFSGAEDINSAIVRVRPAVGDSSLTGAASIDFMSVETGRYPSSVIITDPTAVGSAAPLTRMAEKLYVPIAADVAPEGYFHAVLTLAPHYASGEQDSEHDLLYFDDMNRLYLRADNAVALREGGADALATSPLTWARDQAITVEVVSTAAERRLRVSVEGGADESVPGSPGAAFPVTGPLHLLGNATGSQEGADLRAITFHPPM